MKTIKLSLLAIIFIAFSSCSKDDEPDTNTSMMLGEWNLSTFNYQGTSDATYEGMNLSTSYTGEAENVDFTLTFNDDNTFKAQGKYDVRLIVEGITQVVSMDNTASSGDWSVDGNVLNTSTLFTQINGSPSQGESASKLIIKELTANRMVLTFDQESEISQSGLDYTISLNGEYVLTK